MRVKVFYILCLIATKVYSQEIKIKLAGAEYDVCTSFAYAEQLNPDSVKGFCLQSKGYKDFPKEILKYKNIIVLDLSSKHLDEMVEYLNRSEKKAYKKRKQNGGKQFGYPLFRPNTVLTIPEDITSLKKLKVIHLVDMYVSLEAIKKIEQLLPNVIVIPTSENLEAELKSK